MDKTAYVALAMVVMLALGVTYALFSGEESENVFLSDLDEYDVRIAKTLGLIPTKDVSYIIRRPDIPLYNYPLRPLPEIEYLVNLIGGNPNHRKVIKEIKELREELDQSFYVYGKVGDLWVFVDEEVSVTTFYEELVVGFRYVNYGGQPLTKEEILKINTAAERMAEIFKMDIKYQIDVSEAVSKGIELSNFYHEYDQWVALALKAPDDKPFTGREIHDVAIGLGFKWGEFNNYHWVNPDEYIGDEYLLSIANIDYEGDFVPEEMIKDDYTTSGIIVGFYLPTSPDPMMIYKNLLTVLYYFQERLGGTIINLEGVPQDREDLERIEIVVMEMAIEMEDYGMKPGHQLALCFFM